MSSEDTRICWLGALAMGLAVSSQRDRDRVNELVEASAGDLAALEAARRRVNRLRLGDPTVYRTALALLDDAIADLSGATLEIDLTTGEMAAEVG